MRPFLHSKLLILVRADLDQVLDGVQGAGRAERSVELR